MPLPELMSVPTEIHRSTLNLLAAQASTNRSGSSFILLLLPVAMYFLMVRPRRKQMKKQADVAKSIGVADRIVLTSGIYGLVTAINDSTAIIEIAPNVTITVDRRAVLRKADTDQETPPGSTPDDPSAYANAN